MRFGRRTAMPFLAAALAALIAGCGGQSNGSGQQDGSERAANGVGAEQQQGGEETQSEAAEEEVRTATGVVGNVAQGGRRFVLRPQEGEPMVIQVVDTTRVSLEGEEVEPTAIERGQSAVVAYVVGEQDRNRAGTVQLTSAEG